MDVFAFTSLSETQGLVLIEAMAAGVPVVALDAPGVREVVADRHNGRLLGTMDQQSYVAALLWVLGHTPAALHNIKQAARITARKFPIDSAAKHMLAIYENLRGSKVFLPGRKYSSHPFSLRHLKAEWDICRNYIKAAASAVGAGNFQETEPMRIIDTTGK